LHKCSYSDYTDSITFYFNIWCDKDCKHTNKFYKNIFFVGCKLQTTIYYTKLVEAYLEDY